MLRLGIIGCGRVTSMFHLKAIDQVDTVSVAAISDVNEDRLKETLSDCSGAKGYQDYKQLLMDGSVEAVAINTPPRFHEEMVIDALRAGKHVLCEKPLAESVEGCIRIKELQMETGLTVLPAHNYSFSPSLTMMANRVKNGVIGKVTGMDTAFENYLKSYRSRTDFREHTSNGIVEDVLPHIISAISPIVGHVGDVNSVNWWCNSYEVCDNMETELKSTNGIPINAKLSWTKLRPRFSIAVTGEKGRLYTDLMINPFKLETTIEGKTTTIKEKGVKWYLDLIQFKHPSFVNQYKHFHDLVKENAAPVITIDDEINILQTMEKVSEKME
jgi:predicted dehydrogenase